MAKTILITGASGFIGRALTERLLRDPSNTKIVLLSRTNRFESLANKKQVVPVIGDINNVELLVYILKTHQVTHVYHLASQAIISEYIKNPRQAYLDTVYGVTSLLEAVRISQVPVKKVIISTSYKVYGRSEPPYNEDTLFLPGNTYETAKACQDFIAQDYFRSFNVPVIIFRTVNVYGPGDIIFTRLISKSFSHIYSNKQPTVYASVKDSVREFVYIDDLIDALLLLQNKALPGEVYCVGGHQHSIYEVVSTICEVSGYKKGVQITETDHVIETKEHRLDSSKLERLGWEKRTTLKKGLRKTNDYYKKLFGK